MASYARNIVFNHNNHAPGEGLSIDYDQQYGNSKMRRIITLLTYLGGNVMILENPIFMSGKIRQTISVLHSYMSRN